MRVNPLFLLIILLAFSCSSPEKEEVGYETEVLVVGGGASGVPAAIQAARMGARVVLVEQTDWLGGMLTAAGVSATDGNHNLPSGIWGEFRQKLYDHYGGPEAIFTGWVSNTQFEPSVGNMFFHEMVKAEPNITLIKNATLKSVAVKNGSVVGAYFTDADGQEFKVNAKVTVEATEYGDVLALSGARNFIGMDPQMRTGEGLAPLQGNDMIQDLTYVAILKDYGEGQDVTISEPEGYDPAVFNCSCADYCDDEEKASKLVSAEKMLEYGRLPNDKFMINWPIEGNDSYVNSLEETPGTRSFEEAKLHTLRFVYFIQHELGFTSFGLADDEFPTDDQLAMIPYHRESRRVDGMQLVTVDHLKDPYAVDEELYKFGVAVGDYPLDHHRDKNPNPIEIEFPSIPSFSIPYGSLIPKDMDGLIVAEKSISTSSLSNGSTRLQPCVMGIGQAAGMAAALAVKFRIQPRKVEVRQLQVELMKAGVYIQPYMDISKEDWYFEPLQILGATGVMKANGVPYRWANQTWIYPDSLVSGDDLEGWAEKLEIETRNIEKDRMTVEEAMVALDIEGEPPYKIRLSDPLRRKEAAALLLMIRDPFEETLYLE